MNAAAPASPQPKRPILLGVILAVIGVGLAALAWSMVADVRHLARNGVRAEAQVVSIEEHRRKGVSSYYPVFLFRTAEGRVVRERSAVSVSSTAGYTGGQRVPVLYDPANPSNVRSVASVDEGAGVVPWIIGGFALAAFGLAALAVLKRPAGAAGPPATGAARPG